MDIRWGMLVGFAILLITVNIVIFLISWVARKYVPEQVHPDTWRMRGKIFSIANMVMLFSFVIAMLWTGITFYPSDNPVGKIDTDAAKKIEYVAPKNRPDQVKEKLDEEADEQLEETIVELENFRKRMLKN